jgi:hypothetical protein
MTTPEAHENCSMCEMRRHEREAAAGLRCLSCLQAFTDPFINPDVFLPELCTGCGVAARAPRVPRVVAYGSAGPYRGLEATGTEEGGNRG